MMNTQTIYPLESFTGTQEEDGQTQTPASGQSPVQDSSVQDSSAAPQNGTDEIAED